MNVSLKKTAIAAVAALALGAGVAVSTTSPAAAACNGRYCYGGGGGGWHHHGGGGGWGWGVGAGILGGAVLGAAIANSNNGYYESGPAYGDSCWQPQPIYDRWGRYLGRRMVNVCY